MTNYVVLDSKNLADLRVAEGAENVHAESVRNTYVIVNELQRVSGSYPAFFTKNPTTGMFSLIALFGFDEGENLFVKDKRWAARYIPLNIRRGPFALGNSKNEGNTAETVVVVDMDDGRVGGASGEVLFNEQGFPTDYLEHKMSVLKTLQEGKDKTDQFIRKLLELELIIPATFKVSFDNGQSQNIQGLYTIDQSRLQDLHQETVLHFYQNGYFEYVYMMISSIGQMENLIDRKNATINRK